METRGTEREGGATLVGLLFSIHMVSWPWVGEAWARPFESPSTAPRKVGDLELRERGRKTPPPPQQTPSHRPSLFVSTEKRRNPVVEMESTREGQSVITPLALFLFLYLPFCHGSGGAGDVVVAVGRACGGRGVGECGLGNGVGAEMEAGASRRTLQQQSPDQRYISYRFLNGDAVPCATPGVSYYNCHALPSGNPHTRGCFTIARCRDGYP
ncbi:hypothetical protein Taro_028440 [Colocasia esculenta]|uniref:Uncharacterized protein n=1 Tax=Colocasia esculenta TaxID=4460 RepID=A0A843VRT8_COLES|nr:hypothetical protein [Colocasia esculenta]